MSTLIDSSGGAPLSFSGWPHRPEAAANGDDVDASGVSINAADPGAREPMAQRRGAGCRRRVGRPGHCQECGRQERRRGVSQRFLRSDARALSRDQQGVPERLHGQGFAHRAVSRGVRKPISRRRRRARRRCRHAGHALGRRRASKARPDCGGLERPPSEPVRPLHVDHCLRRAQRQSGSDS